MDLIQTLYRLISKGFEISVENDKVKVLFDQSIKKKDLDNAKKFLIKNKNEIIRLLHKNQNFKNIIISEYQSKIPVSFVQERMWFLYKYSKNEIYNIPLIFRIRESTNIAILKKSLFSTIDRHEVLRTIIKEDDKNIPYQYVGETKRKVDFLTVENEMELQEKFKSLQAYKFDLSAENPMRLTILNDLASNRHYLVLVIHHIAFDGWSYEIFFHGLFESYQYYLNRKNKSLFYSDQAKIGAQYKDFAIWQRSYLDGDILKKELDFWRTKLKDYSPFRFFIDKQSQNSEMHIGGNEDFEFDELMSFHIRIAAKNLEVSLFSLMMSAYILLLSVYNYHEDILIGVPILNRQLPETKDIVGNFLNTVLLRKKIIFNQAFDKFIRDIHEEWILVQQHQNLPFQKIKKALDPDNGLDINHLIQALFSFKPNTQNTEGINEKLDTIFDNNVKTHSLFEHAKFNLTLFVDDCSNKIICTFNYSVSLFEKEIIKSYISTYKLILDQFISQTKDSTNKRRLHLNELNYLNDSDYNKIGYDVQNVKQKINGEISIANMFKEQANKTPLNVAVQSGGRILTYRDLSNQSDLIAKHLISHKGGIQNNIVILSLKRSEQILSAILGILKAGLIYVPLSPDYPEERLKYILDDTLASFVITNDELKNKFHKLNKDIRVVSVNNMLASKGNRSLEVQYSNFPNDLVYILYTSGTTGRPKGVMIEQKSLFSIIQSIQKKFFHEGKPISTYSFTNYVFDIFGLEFGLPLLSGGKIVISNKEEDSNKYIDCSEYDFIQMTPSYFELKLNYLKNTNKTKFFVGGEPLTPFLLKKMLKKSAMVVNFYGPTETTIWSTSKTYLRSDVVPKNISIGRSLDQEFCYILGKGSAILPVNGVGELCISGDGLAKGYLNDPERTKKKFFVQKLFKKPIRIYKTGDLAKWDDSGEIIYLGRRDSQIKISGQRIEIEEIEGALNDFQQIIQSVVVVKERNLDNNSQTQLSNNLFLVGFYKARNDFSQNELVDFLKLKLPSYMIPKVLFRISKIPLTFNGKVDRQKLVNLDLSELSEKIDITEQEGPLNSLEKKLLEIWRDVFQNKLVSIYDDFFTLGGDSILSLKLLSESEKKGIYFSLSDLFRNTCIRKLATKAVFKNILEKEKHRETPLFFDLMPLQKTLMMDGDYKKIAQENWIQLVYDFQYTPDWGKLKDILFMLFQKTETLQVGFIMNNKNEMQQFVQKNLDIPIHYIIEGSDFDYHEILKVDKANVPCINNEYQFRAYIVNKGNGQGNLIICYSHLIMDGWSYIIFLQKFLGLYTAKELKIKNQKKYLEKYFSFARNKNLLLDFWEKYLENVPKLKEKETLRTYPEARKTLFQVDKELSTKILHFSQNEGVSVYITLISTIAIASYALSKHKIQTIGVVSSSGRELLGSNYNDAIGLYANILPMIILINKNRTDLNKVHLDFTNITEHSQISLSEISSHTGFRKKDISCMFAFQNYHAGEELCNSNLLALNDYFITVEYPIEIYATYENERLNFSFFYTSDINEEYINKLIGCFKKELIDIGESIHQQVGASKRKTL